MAQKNFIADPADIALVGAEEFGSDLGEAKFGAEIYQADIFANVFFPWQDKLADPKPASALHGPSYTSGPEAKPR